MKKTGEVDRCVLGSFDETVMKRRSPHLTFKNLGQLLGTVCDCVFYKNEIRK